MKRVVSLFLGLLTVLPLISACGSTVEPEASSTAAVAQTDAPEVSTQDELHDEGGFLKDCLPALDFQDEEIHFLYDTKYQFVEFFAEETTGEAVSDAIYARNLAVEERLGVKFTFTGEAGNHDNHDKFLKKAQADAQADGEFLIYAAYSRTVPLLACNGLCTNLLETQYFDVEKPWWPKALTNECTIHNKLFYCTGDISTNTLWMMSCIFYNADLMRNQHLDTTPEEIVFSGKWTLDRFCEMVKAAYIEGADEISSIYGMATLDTCIDAFLNSCGVISIVKDGDGDLKLSEDFTGERTVNIVEKLGNLITSSKALHQSGSTSAEQAIFYDGRALLIIDGTYVATGNGSGGISFEYGIMPAPKYNEEQQNYMTNVRYPFNQYAINTNASGELKGAASAVIEALASDSYRRVTPILFETMMKSRYSKDLNSAKIYDILRENVVFDLGRIHNYSINNYYPKFRQIVIQGGASWTANIAAISQTMKRILPTLTKVYE